MRVLPTPVLVLLLLAAAAPALGQSGSQPRVERERLVIRAADTDSGEIRRWAILDSESEHPVLFDLQRARRGYLGVRFLELTPELRVHLGAPESAGVMISRVEENSPAAAAGLEPGDIVLELNGKPVRSGRLLEIEIGQRPEGEAVELQVLRRGERIAVPVTLAEREQRQLDLGALLWHPGHGELRKLPPAGGEEGFLEIEPRAMGEAILSLREQLSSPEWRRRLEAMGRDGGELDERLRKLEERLSELEKRLSELDDSR